MISMDMTVREMVALASNPSCAGDLYERIVKALEKACGDTNLNVTLRSLPRDSRIYAIKALRLATGWGLKESKDFCDVVLGQSDVNGYFWGGTANTVTLKADAANQLVKEWKAIGCDVMTDTFNC